jgi:hypothetical protein
MAALEDGTLAAHWLVRSGGETFAYDVHIALSRDGVVNWSGPFRPHGDGTETEHGFVSLVPTLEGSFRISRQPEVGSRRDCGPLVAKVRRSVPVTARSRCRGDGGWVATAVKWFWTIGLALVPVSLDKKRTCLVSGTGGSPLMAEAISQEGRRASIG